MERNDLWLNVKGNYMLFGKYFGIFTQKIAINLTKIQFNAIPLIFDCFLMHRKQLAMSEKIDEFESGFSLQKLKKGWLL